MEIDGRLAWLVGVKFYPTRTNAKSNYLLSTLNSL
jgi:hypothetical protein